MFESFKLKVFARLFLSYVIYFIIPFAITGALLFNYVFDNYKKDILSLNLNATSYIKHTFDSKLSDIYSLAYILSDNPHVIGFATNEFSTPTDSVIAAKQVADAIKVNKAYRDAVYSTKIYFREADCIVATDTTYSQREYYNAYFSHSNISLNDLNAVLHGTKNRILLLYESQELITVFMPILTDANGCSAMLISAIDSTYILESYKTLTSDMSKSHLIIGDSERNILIKTKGTPEEIDLASLSLSADTGTLRIAGDYLATYNKSVVSSLNYICLFSEKDVLSDMRYVGAIIISLLILCLLIFLINAYMFSLKTFSPFKTMISVKYSQTNSHDIRSYSQIQDLMTDIINSNSNLYNLILNQRERLANNLFKMFLQNSMDVDADSLQTMFGGDMANFKHPYYQVAVLETAAADSDKLTLLHFSILTNLRNFAASQDIVHFVIPSDTSNIIIMFNHGGAEGFIHSFCVNIIEPLNQNGEARVLVGIGRIVDSLETFSKSYEDALYALNTKEEKISSYNGSNSNSLNSVYFSGEEKIALMDMVISGNTADVNTFFRQLTTNILEKNVLTSRTLAYVRFLLVTTFSDIVDTIQMRGEFIDKYIAECQQLLVRHDYSESFKALHGYFAALTKYIYTSRTKSGALLKKTVTDYVAERYSNPNISLKQMSLDLHVSYNYLCKFFKEQTGSVFLDYLHNLRIDRAKALLAESTMSIADIAAAVGYLNVNTFIRTFKKITHITPGEFRKIQSRHSSTE